MDLFASEKSKEPIRLPLANADVIYYPSFFTSEEASKYYKILLSETSWQQDDIKLFGKIYKQPRLTALYGNNDQSYSYSGIKMLPKPFSKTLNEIKNYIEKVSEVSYTTVLLNLYRDGNDSNGWHSDDEKELGTNPTIASISLGANRMFHFKNRKDKNLRYKLLLEHGSLLVMKGSTQHYWQHQLPKSTKVTEPRINLTFRVLEKI
jgi:alkylated DNA repair dioxygenase AlkB